MESPQESQYTVITTRQAEAAFYQFLDYLYENYPLDRAEELANQLRDKTKELHYLPERGSAEPDIRQGTRRYRSILFERTPRAQIKIIYYIDKASHAVYVTDFFPTEKDTANMKG